MKAIDTTATTRLHPTAGQCALVHAVATVAPRNEGSVRTIPASAYTDPARWQAEKTALFNRLPRLLLPKAALPDPGSV